MCREAPVARQAYNDDVRRYGSRVSFSGIVGDQKHKLRKSDHNCSQDKRYTPGYAHALDTHVGADKALGREIVAARLKDPRVKYVIFDGKIYYPDGTVKKYTGPNPHSTHVHTSFLPGTTFDIRPFYDGETDVTPEQMATLGRWMQDQAKVVKDAVEALQESEYKTRRIVVDVVDAAGDLDRSKLTAETKKWLADAKVA